MANNFEALQTNSATVNGTEKTKSNKIESSQNVVRFNLDDEALQRDATSNAPIKSIGKLKESKVGSSSRGLITGSVRLFSKKTTNTSQELSTKLDNKTIQEKHILRYVDGNFASGKIVDLNVDRCYVTAFEPTDFDHSDGEIPLNTDRHNMPLLAVGTAKSILIYETTLYALVCEVPRNGTISAIKWIPTKYRPSNSGTWHTLLAVSDLNGMVALYSIDKSILECQGPTLVHEFSVCDQVRAMDCCLYENHDATTLLMIVGDKSGNVTFSSLRLRDSDATNEVSLEHIDTFMEKDYKSAVLGLAICTHKNLLAISTKGGQVEVYTLNQRNSCTIQTKQLVWETTRSGPVRCVIFSADGSQLGFGGYDKNVVFVETTFWTNSRLLNMSGTINTLSLDPQNRYLGVGCRDKSFTLFDTSTYVAVKTFHTASWVTSISWGQRLGSFDVSLQKDIVAIRSDNSCISILDLSPIGLTDVRLSSRQGDVSSISWNQDTTLVARSSGVRVIVSDCLEGFKDIWSYEMKGEVTNVAFSHSEDLSNMLAVVDESGYLVLLQLQFQDTGELQAIATNSTSVDSNLKALTCSPDGTVVATGGRSKFLYLFNRSDLQPQSDPIKLSSRVWDIEYVPKQVIATTGTKLLLAVALGDYTTIFLNDRMEVALQIHRTRTCRCLSFNPLLPYLAIGDGDSSVTMVDYVDEGIIKEFDVNGRVNVLRHSLAGDYLVVGSDSAYFSIHETKSYKVLQEIKSEGFALSASFSPTGMFLALGSANEDYKILRLGPFLAINLIPLSLIGGIEQIPPWALKEALFRSWDGPSFVQRHMITGESDNLRRVASILRTYPNAIYTFNRRSGEGSFTTAVQQKIPNLLKLAMVTLVDGTLAPKNNDDKNFITTDIPYQGRQILADIVKNYPPEFSVDVFKAITFLKVPFTSPKVVKNGARLEKGSASYTDPWSIELDEGYSKKSNASLKSGQGREFITRTPAVLSLPGLGDMDFLASILMYAPLEVFENEAMAVVVRVVWYNHIRKFFLLDCALYTLYYVCWITLLELTLLSRDNQWEVEWITLKLIAMATSTFNTVFAVKEIMQIRLGNRELYLKSWWNIVDVLSIIGVYVFTLGVMIYGNIEADQVPLAVVTTLLLTSRVLAYLRGFGDTGWLISVLVANFRDVRGYLFILLVILIGFSVSFRVLFRDASEGFDTLRRSFLSTFQMTLTSQYDAEVIFSAEHHILAAIVFVMAITGVLVVALNALISILADSYARVQQNAVANRRREVAALIVEYMSLLPHQKRRDIEKRTMWFHTLLEVDADGSLQVQADDWEGGINALRHDMHTIADTTKVDTQKAMTELKNDFDSELLKFKKEVLTMLEGIRDDIKVVRRVQGIKLPDGRNVVKAVQAVQAVGQKVGEHGGAFLRIADRHAVKTIGQYRAKSISNFSRA